MKVFWKIKALAAGEAEILLYEFIGEDFFGKGMSAKRFAEDLKSLGELNKIIVRINSPGGDVFDGVAIYNTLLNHKAKVNTFIDGLAASIASVIALAGDAVTIADNAMFMMHNPWTIAIGDAREMEKVAETLDKIRESLVVTYSKRSGKDAKAIIKLLDAETWLTGQEAVDEGFADKVSEAKAVAANFKMVAKYKHAPAALLEEKPEPAPIDESFNGLDGLRMRLDLLQQTF